jgi:hypothetical protein
MPLKFRVVKPLYEDDPVKVEGQDGNVRVRAFIPVVAMQDLCDDSIIPEERVQ